MMSGAIVLVPTHDHAALLAHSIASAQRQTVEDLDIVVIGDAVGDDTRDLLASLVPEDDRITFLDLAKSGRTGELHRHRVLSETTRPVAVYLSDDDLLLPNHVESVTAALVDHDVVFSLPTLINEHGRIAVEPIDLSDTSWAQMVAEGDRSLLSLTGFAHTLEAYRRLPFGWRDTPAGHFTDEWMYRQFFSQSWVRATTAAPTALRLPSVLRIGVGIEERLEELAGWSERVSTLKGVEVLLMDVEREIVSSASTWRRWALDANDRLGLERNHSESLVWRVADADARCAMAGAERDQLDSEAADLRSEVAGLRSEVADLRARLDSAEAECKNLRDHYVAMTNERNRETRRAEVAEALVAGAPTRRLISLLRRVRRTGQRWFGSSGRGTST